MHPSQIVVITGGQSGVDRAALDVACEFAIPYFGYCPRGGWAEDCPEPPGVLARYPHLRETPLADPAQRTEWNVRDSDAVLIITDRNGLAASKGTALAHELAEREGKPFIVLGLDQAGTAVEWLDGILSGWTSPAPFRLGIGGPRESEATGIYVRTVVFLQQVLRGR